MTFRKILVPYDQSKYADKALNNAINLAKMIKGSEIIILNVMEEIPTPPAIFTTRVRHHKTGEDTTLSTYLRDLQTDMRYKMMNTLEEVKQKYKNSEVKIRTQVLVGLPEDRIVEFADRHKIDLIVMGSRGLKGISRFIRGLGSVSRNVSEKVKCTVMIVR
ncbi:MAG TPA: universal stress protein [Nitrososphaeraceae archaeon]